MVGLEIVLPVLLSLIGGLVTYFTAVRRLSGKIKTSTAEDLWAESRSMRHELADRIKQLNAVMTGMQDHIDALEAENAVLKQEVDDLRKQVERR